MSAFFVCLARLFYNIARCDMGRTGQFFDGGEIQYAKTGLWS